MALSALVSNVTASVISPSRASLGCIRGAGHGFGTASSLAVMKEKCDHPGELVANRRRAPWMKVRASSSEETSSAEKVEENVPKWADPNTDEPPPWAKNEKPATQEPAQEIPFGAYLIGSVLVAIAAVGSVFEFFNKNPVFGVVQPDSPLWAPILGFFAFTGLPTAGFLFFKAIQLANKASEEADKQDGYKR